MPTYQINTELNGIEIYFELKPSEDVLQELRDNGWKWHSRKKCWYNKNTPNAKKLADSLCYKSVPTPHPTETGLPVSASISNAVYYNVFSGEQILSTVTITKNHNDTYTIHSTNNQMVCCDCNRFYSIHAHSCPFCGCPISYAAEHYFQRFSRTALPPQQQEPQQPRKLDPPSEPDRPKLTREDRRKLMKSWEEELNERTKPRIKELREKRKQELAGPTRTRAEIGRIQGLCKKYSVSDALVNIIIKSKISVDDFERRVEKILYYQKEYPHLGIDLSRYIANDSISEYVQEHLNRKRKHCVGNCSTCERIRCILDEI